MGQRAKVVLQLWLLRTGHLRRLQQSKYPSINTDYTEKEMLTLVCCFSPSHGPASHDHRWASDHQHARPGSSYALPPLPPTGNYAPTAPMMGGALPGQAGYRGAVPLQPATPSQAHWHGPNQPQQNMHPRPPVPEHTGQFDHLKQMLGNYHDPHAQGHQAMMSAPHRNFGPSPPHSERAYTATPPSKNVQQHQQNLQHGQDGWRAQSPTRPEYSPLSDAGGQAREHDPRSQQWR